MSVQVLLRHLLYGAIACAGHSSVLPGAVSPRRSPQLNVCDFALWSEINRRMRTAERKWPAGRTESRKQFLARLRRTAMSLPQTFVDESIGNMRKRCKCMFEAGGGHFEEGGK